MTPESTIERYVMLTCRDCGNSGVTCACNSRITCENEAIVPDILMAIESIFKAKGIPYHPLVAKADVNYLVDNQRIVSDYNQRIANEK